MTSSTSLIICEALDHWRQLEAAHAEGIDFIQGMRLLAGAPKDLGSGGTSREDDREWAFVNAGTWLSLVLAGLRNPDTLGSAKCSRSFRGVLRPYQATGHKWLRFLSALGLGACLADDMGLGKTVQLLSQLVSLKEGKKDGEKPSLLVLPASLLANWRDEMKRFAPTLEACFVHPAETGKAEITAMCLDPAVALAGVGEPGEPIQSAVGGSAPRRSRTPEAPGG